MPYLLALLLLGLATATTDLLWPHDERSPFALYYLAIIIATGLGSTRAGVCVLLGSAAVVNYLFLPPYRAFSLQPAGLVPTALFGCVSALIIPVVHRLRKERASLHVTQERLQAVVEHLTEGLIISNLAGRLLISNRASIKMHGFASREEWSERLEEFVDIFELSELDGTVLDLPSWPLMRIIRGEPLRDCEVRLRRRGTRWERIFCYSGNIVQSADGESLAFIAITDVTERSRAERALLASEKRHQRIADNVPGMLYQLVAHPDGTYDLPFVSEGCRDIFGVEPRRLQEDPALLTRALHPEDRAAYEQSVAASTASLQPWHWEGRYLLNNGATQWVQAGARPELQPDDTIIWEGLLMDVTERKQTEELRAAKETAERASVAKSEFLSRMSHELRTPLNAILGFGQLLEIALVDHQENTSVDHILKAGNHLLKLINEVLDIARIESGRIELSPEPVPVHGLVHESLAMIRPLAAERQVAMVVVDDANPPTGRWTSYVRADRQRLRQVLLNLLSNAVKYNAIGGRVSVECTPGSSPEHLRVRITDTGRGIPAAQRAWLFKPFERLGKEFSNVEGTGLGLALCKGIMESMGGAIGLEDDPPLGECQGSAFWIEIPLSAARPDVPLPAADDNTGGVAHGHALPPGSRILYVEDNLPNVLLVQRLLERSPGVELLTAMHGQTGLDLARQHRPDLILLDAHLPDFPGWEVLARLQADPETAAIPVVVISADATERQVQRMKDMGAFAYLTKPIDVPSFLRTVREALSAAHLVH